MYAQRFSPRVSFCCLAGLMAILLSPFYSLAQSGFGAPRIVAHVDDARLTVLKGNTRPEARAAFDRGPVASNLPMGDLVLVLRRGPERQAAFDAFLASQNDPASPNFRHWLTPEQIGEQFGPAQADIDTISAWLQNHGLNIESVAKDRMTIRFGGVASQVTGAFHTEIHSLNVRGDQHIANMTDPSIPEALTPVVVGVKALHNFFPHPLHRMGSEIRRNSQTGKWERISNPVQTPSNLPSAKPGAREVEPLFNTGGTTNNAVNIEDVGPYDFATIYNVLPLWSASTPIDGTGQKVAIAGTSDINLDDVVTFRTAFGLPVAGSKYPTYKAPTIIDTNSAPGDCSTGASSCINDLYENTLDVEWSGAIAKNAEIVLVASSAPTATTDPLYLSEHYIVENVTAPVMSVSYGECELGLATAGNTEYNDLWSTAQMAGIAVFVATGDEGSASCDAGLDTSVPYGAQYGLSVSGLASTPYNTAVGGTDFNWAWSNQQSTYWSATNNTATLSSALGYIPEFPWNDTCTNPLVVSALNSANNFNFTATQYCDFIGTGQLTSNNGSLYGLVDIVGGSGGKSSCINGDGQTVASCTQGYPKPSWQTGVTGIPADSARDIPDVSFFAANGFSGSAYVVCVSTAGTCSYTADTEPTGEEVGGTSVSSPVMAGVMALVNQKAGTAQGNPNEVLYELAAKETYSGCSSEKVGLTGSSCVFNDIDTGTIAMPCNGGSPDCTGTGDYGVLNGYSSTAGFDLASGLGSMNVANFVGAYYAEVAGSYKLTGATDVTVATAGGSGTSTVTATATGGYTGTITLTCSVAAITGGIDTPSCTGSTITVAAGKTTATGTITLGTTAASTSFRSANLKADARGAGTKPWIGFGGVSLAGILLLAIPARRRVWRSMLGVVALIALAGVAAGTMSGCGSSSSSSKTIPGTTAGSYTVTVTGADTASATSTTTFTLTVK